MPAADEKPTYSLIYTGRLFGYFRYPDIQNSAQVGCPAESDVPLPTQVAQFRSALQKMKASGQELIAMGDNFAPELLARTMRIDMAGSARDGQLAAKDLFESGPGAEGWIFAGEASPQTGQQRRSGGGAVPSDNVGCFFRLMGFDAIVPGPEDFYFGAARLREIARFLAKPPSGVQQPVQMLAANLLLDLAPAPANAPSSGVLLPNALRQALAPTKAIQFDLPAQVMPWLKEVTIHTPSESPRVFDCLATRYDAHAFKLPSQPGNTCVRLQETRSGSRSYQFASPANPSGNFLPAYDSLDPGDNHALCVEYREGAKESTSCKLFPVKYPFLQYHPDTAGTTPAPYYLPQDRAQAAVFGVLDPDIAKRAGEFTKRGDATIAISDAVDALRQVLQLCDSNAGCRDRHKVLLAQMPFYKASQLAARLKAFDVIIVQPDADRATGDEYAGESGVKNSAFLMTPGVAYQSGRPDVLSTNLRRVDYYAGGSEENSPKRFLTNQVQDLAIAFPNEKRCRTCPLTAQAAAITKTPGTDPGEVYSDLALESMRRSCHADVALLQRRDIFTGFERAVQLWPRDFHYTPQQLLDEVLWKGDFTLCASLKGSSLRAVLTQSRAYDQQELDELSVGVEKGRGLYTLGVQTDPTTGSFLVRGSPVQDDALYAVALPSEIAFGNAGYLQFPNAAIPPGENVSWLRPQSSLSGLACSALPKDISKTCESREFTQREQLYAVQQRPNARGEWQPEWLNPKRWAAAFHGDGQSSALVRGSAEDNVARRGLWWFRVQNLSLGYALSFIGGSDRTLPGFFVGNNSFSQLSTPEQATLNLWGRVRGGYSFPRFVDFYVSAEAKYTRAALRNSTEFGNFGDYQINLPANLMRDEAGLLSKPLWRRVPVRLLASENLLTQVAAPIQQFYVPPPCLSGPCVTATTLTTYNLNKNYQLLSKFGARIENSRNWIEAGREYGANINTAYDYALDDPGRAQPFSCQIATYATLSNCVRFDPLFSTQSRIIPLTNTRYIGGWFLNFHSELPLHQNRLQLMLDSYGEVFDKRREDTTFDTRFYEDLTLSLNVPIWGNLTFAPQVETFYFQNKVLPGVLQPNHYVFVSSSLTLGYSFDWHRGVGLGNALRYPTGTSTGVGETSR